jgi:hypothetical protein
MVWRPSSTPLGRDDTRLTRGHLAVDILWHFYHKRRAGNRLSGRVLIAAHGEHSRFPQDD